MTAVAPEPPSSTPPDRPHCGHGSAPADPVGCRGISVGGHTACLAHVNAADRAACLSAPSPGADLDHRGAPFTPELLSRLLRSTTADATGDPRLGDARFEGAAFSGDARFEGATFSGDALFDGVTFSGPARFGGARFSGDVTFGEARFEGTPRLGPLVCGKRVVLDGAVFQRPVTVDRRPSSAPRRPPPAAPSG
jgi:hypothetical protein